MTHTNFYTCLQLYKKIKNILKFVNLIFYLSIVLFLIGTYYSKIIIDFKILIT